MIDDVARSLTSSVRSTLWSVIRMLTPEATSRRISSCSSSTAIGSTPLKGSSRQDERRVGHHRAAAISSFRLFAAGEKTGLAAIDLGQAETLYQLIRPLGRSRRVIDIVQVWRARLSRTLSR